METIIIKSVQITPETMYLHFDKQLILYLCINLLANIVKLRVSSIKLLNQ